MLKAQPHFRLDRSYKGPFVVQSVTSTNAVIKAKDIENAEEINVSRHRLSLCWDQMKFSNTWIGHSNKLYKRRKVHRRKTKEQQVDGPEDYIAATCASTEQKCVTRSGRHIKKPVWFRVVTVPGSSQEEVARTNERNLQSDGTEQGHT